MSRPEVVTRKEQVSPAASCEACAWRFNGLGSSSASRGHAAATGHAVVVERAVRTTYLVTELHPRRAA